MQANVLLSFFVNNDIKIMNSFSMLPVFDAGIIHVLFLAFFF